MSILLCTYYFVNPKSWGDCLELLSLLCSINTKRYGFSGSYMIVQDL